MIIDLTGQRFGKLTVLHRGEVDENKKRLWVCRCDCGQITKGCTGDLHRGYKKTCGICRSGKPVARTKEPRKSHINKNLEGQRFGQLVALSAVKQSGSSGRRGWLCQCDCGKTKFVTNTNLLRGSITSCGKCFPRAPQRKYTFPSTEIDIEFQGLAAFNSLYVHYRADARRRNHPFELTRKQFSIITQSPCFYCGLPPSQLIGGRHRPYTYSGIDRIDSKQGYTIDNARACCWQCNWAKSDWTEQEFLDWAQRVSTHQNNKRSEIVK